MNYELIQKLKDAGFKNIRLCNRIDEHKIKECTQCCNELYPTLSELVEACGDELFSLQREEDDDGYKGWLAGDGTTTCVKGSTPEIAIANLWLALNKK